MPKEQGYYGSYGGAETGAEFKPSGEPVKGDSKGSIEGSGVPGSPASAGFPSEPDQSINKEPIGGLTFEEAIRRATNEAAQPINKPGASADISGGSKEARSVEAGA